jgi:hypothetical protein
MRQGGQQVQYAGVFRLGHFCTVFLLERKPLPFGCCVFSELHRLGAGRQIRQPHIVPVLRGESCLWHTPGWTPDRPDTKALAFDSLAAKSQNTHSHKDLLSMKSDKFLCRQPRLLKKYNRLCIRLPYFFYRIIATAIGRKDALFKFQYGADLAPATKSKACPLLPENNALNLLSNCPRRLIC